jgi:basic amino acid/polyamine antiporter, APA family
MATIEKAAQGNGKVGFVRGLKLLDATTLVIGTVIGSGIFIVSADIARIVKSPGLMLLTWLIGGGMTVMAALSYAELSAAMPKAGGQYVYLREAFGKLVAFLYGWTFFLVMSTGLIAAVAVAFAKFLGIFLPAVAATNIVLAVGPVTVSTQQLVAMAVVATLTAVNCRGLREGALVQNIFTFLKVAAVVALVVAGFTVGRNAEIASANFSQLFGTMPATGWNLLPVIGAAMVGSLFAMDAWVFVCCTAAEVENPRKNLPRALLYGTGFVALLYIVVNLAYMNVLPFFGDPAGADIVSRGMQFAADDRVATAAAQQMLGPVGLFAVAAAIMISTFGCVNGSILTGARLYYAMARDGLFFRACGKLSPTRHVPTTALIVGGIWTCLLTLSGSYSQLLDYVIFATLIFYPLTIAGLFVLRKKRPDMERPYKAWGYPVVPIIYIVLALAIAVDLLIYKPAYTWPGLIIVLTGIPVYYFWRWRSKGMECS